MHLRREAQEAQATRREHWNSLPAGEGQLTQSSHISVPTNTLRTGQAVPLCGPCTHVNFKIKE